jgi:hypothetical protein
MSIQFRTRSQTVVDYSEYITNSYWAISAVQELDPMTAEGRAMKNRILTRCFKIIDMCVDEMYSELFDPSADD